MNPAAEAARQAKKLLYAPERWAADRAGPSRRPRRARPLETGEWASTPFADAVGAKVVGTPSGRFGYLRLWSFSVADDRAFVDEVVRLLGLLPERGLIVDLRANPGGLIWAAERLLQLFVPHEVEPTRFSLLATPLTRAMAAAPQNDGDLGPWRASLDDAIATGELYSQALPITSPGAANDTGQVYGGPVVAVVDANTYSAGDLFAAGFHDNEVGVLVTVGTATGAGGANVWEPDQVRDALLSTPFAVDTLPAGTGYTLSVRRATRAGAASGMAIEDVGVRGHRTYAMTRDDLVGDNRDLLAFCGAILTGQPVSGLTVTAGAGEIEVQTTGLDRIDVFVDGRPEGWHTVGDGATRI
ncbi:MAG: S41 family peptidase, partial [Acidimicrobiales bacterium]